MANFRPDPAQIALYDAAADFAAGRLAPHALEWDQQKHLPRDVLVEAAGLGFAGLYVPDAFGGAGLGRLDGVLVFEALATGCPVVAAWLSVHNMVAGMIARAGTHAQQAAWLPGLARLDVLGAYCLSEPDCGSDAAALRCRAVRDGDGWRISGTKQFITGAGVADLYAVMARSGGQGADGITCFLVPAGAPGLSFGPNEKKMGWHAQPTRQVILEAVSVADAARLGGEGQGFALAMAALDGGRLNIAACSIGGAQAALTGALAYMGARRAFGRKLTEFQALQFRLADMATELEAARLLLYRAASALDGAEPAATGLCAMAKRLATDTGFAVADAALQMLGGYGYLAEYGIEKLVRDLRVHRILEGTNEIMRLIVARSLLAQ